MRLSIAATAICLSAVTAATQSVDTLNYSLIMAGHPAGFEKDWRNLNGTWNAHYEFNDRGRGPSYDETITLAPDGTQLTVTTTGHDYLKTPVAESYSVMNNTGIWKNSAEAGSAPITVPVFYNSMDGANIENTILARLLLRAPGHSIKMLPAGEAHIDSVGSVTLHANGASRTVIHYSFSGFGFAPVSLWYDTDTTLFAVPSSWMTVIRKGWESSAGELIAIQTLGDSVRTARMAASLAHKPKGIVVFKDADLFDALTGTIVPHTTIVVQGDKIIAVGPNAKVQFPAGAQIIDAAGKTVMPGMWDMHVHTGDDDGLMFLQAGITTVRDLGNDVDESLVRQKRFGDGSLLGPRLILAALIDGPGPFAGPTKLLVDNPDSARAIVDRVAKLGYVQIKIYSSVKPELVPVIAAEAHKLGLRVSGHVPAFMTATQAVKAGYDEIQHANFLFLNFWIDSVPDTRTPARFTAVAQKAALLDLGSPSVQDFVALLKAHHTVLDPTVNVFENMFVARKGTVDPGYTMVADRLPSGVRRGLLTGGLPVPEGMDQRYKDSFAAMLKMVKMMHDNGLVIVAGTDGFPGFAYDRELELYVQAGIAPNEVLQIATIGAARVMKMDKALGSVSVGKLADMIVVDGHPASNISDVRKVSVVMKNGVLYSPAELDKAVGIKPN
jgi:imidazolonepropionase-like amidohydrolase